MAEKNKSFNDSLKEAQNLGLAEADPTMDIDGTTQHKKRLSWQLYL